MSINQFVDSTGTTLNQYTLKESGQTDRTVQLVFTPSSDYVAGTTFSASNMNPIITKVNELDTAQTILQGTLSAGQTAVTISDARITTNSILSFYTSIYGENPTNVSVSDGSVTLIFETQSVDMTVGVRVDGTI